MDLLHELLVNAIAFGIVAVAAVAALCWLRWPGGRWLPLQSLRPGAWTGGEVALAFLTFLVVPAMLVLLLEQAKFFQALGYGDLSPLRQQNLVAAIAICLVLAIQVTVLHAVSRTQQRHLGVSVSRWRSNLALGGAGFLVVTLPILALHLAATALLGYEPHPMTRLAQEQLTFTEWTLIVVQAGLLGPILEEWMFRGLLQGWLRRTSLVGHLMVALFTLYIGAQPTLTTLNQAWRGAEVEVQWGSLVFSALAVAVYAAGVVVLWRPVLANGLADFVNFEEADAEEGGDAPAQRVLPVLPVLAGVGWERFKHANARWAIVGSSMLWAVFHHQAWPSPIALFFLGLILGWLAYRTQSLIPGITLHALFNLVACFVLIYTASEAPSGNNETTAVRPDSGVATVSTVPGP